MEKKKCAGHTYQGRIGMLPCHHTGRIDEDGKSWCAVHAPSRIKAKQDARDAASKREWAIRDADAARRRAISDAKTAVIEAAKQWEAAWWRDKETDTAASENLVSALRALRAAEEKGES